MKWADESILWFNECINAAAATNASGYVSNG